MDDPEKGRDNHPAVILSCIIPTHASAHDKNNLPAGRYAGQPPDGCIAGR